MIEHALFITGAQRSGTTLLEKLLGAQDGVSMLSQPFPFLFSDTKRAFLRTIGGADDAYPLGHLFRETRYDASAFADFLETWRTTAEELRVTFTRMESYSGQYTRFSRDRREEAFARLPPHADFAETVAVLDRELAQKRDAVWFGSKETICEEYVPALLARGFRCIIIVRDPRDVVASLNHGRGHEHGGALKPTLFNVRNWRKSVTIARASRNHPRFHWCRYEDLVADPARELHRIGLGDAVPAEIHDADGAPWRGNSSHGEHRGVSAASIGVYRHTLPTEVAAFIEATCLPELQDLGYATTLSRADAARIIETFREPYTITRPGLESDAATPENAAIEIERLAEHA